MRRMRDNQAAAIARPGAVTIDDILSSLIGQPQRPFGHFYVEGGEGAGEGDGEGEGGVAVADGQAPDGAGQAAQAAGQEPPAQAAEPFVQIPVRNLDGLDVGRDVNKAIQMAKDYQRLQQFGFVDLAERANGMELDGYQLLSSLLTPSDQQTPQQQQAAGQAVDQVQQQAAAQGQYMTREDAEQFVATQVEQALSGYQQQQSLEQQRSSEEQGYDELLSSLGYTETKADVTVGGETMNCDFVRDFGLMPIFRNMVQHHIDRRLSPTDPNYEAKRGQPASRDVQQLALRDVRNLLTVLSQRGMEQVADQQANLPNATAGEGMGGRAQTPAGDMTRDQRISTAMEGARAKGKIRAADKR